MIWTSIGAGSCTQGLCMRVICTDCFSSTLAKKQYTCECMCVQARSSCQDMIEAPDMTNIKSQKQRRISSLRVQFTVTRCLLCHLPIDASQRSGRHSVGAQPQTPSHKTMTQLGWRCGQPQNAFKTVIRVKMFLTGRHLIQNRAGRARHRSRSAQRVQRTDALSHARFNDPAQKVRSIKRVLVRIPPQDFLV